MATELADARAWLGRRAVLLADPVPAHALLRGKREIGRGEYSIVLDKGDGKRIYKLVSSPADYLLYTAADRPCGCHFAVLYADHGVVCQASSGYPLHLLEMERLHPLAAGTPAAALAARLLDEYWAACRERAGLGSEMGPLALHHVTSRRPTLGDSLCAALHALAGFVDTYGVLPDLLNADNLMVREDGTLVLADPVFMA